MRKQTCLPKWNCCEWGSLFFNPCFSPCSAHAHIKRKLYVFNQHFSGQLHAIVSANYSMTRLLIESTDTGGHSDRLQAMGRLDRLVSYRDPNATFPLWGKTSLSGEKPQTFLVSISEAGPGPWPCHTGVLPICMNANANILSTAYCHHITVILKHGQPHHRGQSHLFWFK